MNEAIQVRDLHVRYRAKGGRMVHAVRGLSFEVQPGEVVGFLGPNGAGKSSTLKALMGFVEPLSGDCRVNGSPAGSEEARARTGYLPEVAMYYPYLTPLETLTLYGELQGLRGKALRDEAMMLLETVGLAGTEKKTNRQLSKGMLQRVGIAQALLGDPEVLILDEVTSGLDPIGRRQLRELLRSRQERGCTLFFSSHELSEVEMLCDRILLIDKGVLIEERDIEALKGELRHYAITYAGEVNLLDLSREWSQYDDTYHATFVAKGDLLAAINRINAQKGRLLDVVAQDGSLEDYFVEAIGRAA